MIELIDNRPIRAAVEEQIASGCSWSSIAKRAGILHPKHGGDTTRLKRMLGVYPEVISINKRYTSGKRLYNKRISYENALRIARAIDRDPVDFGL